MYTLASLGNSSTDIHSAYRVLSADGRCRLNSSAHNIIYERIYIMFIPTYCKLLFTVVNDRRFERRGWVKVGRRREMR